MKKNLIGENSIECILKNMGRVVFDHKPRWVHVMKLFGYGSTTAIALCRKYGIDPDEIIGVLPCGECDECEYWEEYKR